MATYVNYTRNLGFEEDPNYDYLRGLFRKILESHSEQYDFMFDWTNPEDKLKTLKLSEKLEKEEKAEKNKENEVLKEKEIKEQENIIIQQNYNRLQTLQSEVEVDNKRNTDFKYITNNINNGNNIVEPNKANKLTEQKNYKFIEKLNTDKKNVPTLMNLNNLNTLNNEPKTDRVKSSAIIMNTNTNPNIVNKYNLF